MLRIQGTTIDLALYRRAVVIGFGKASIGMGRGLLRVIEGFDVTGILVTGTGEAVAPLEILEGSHPVPDDRSLEAGRRVMEIARAVQADDIVFVLISGGGSSLVEVPAGRLTLSDLAATNRLMLQCGATIGEINTVRKHLSALKGGHLAEAAGEAAVIVTLILSDVVGNPLDVIASGPTMPDPTTFADALTVLERRGLRSSVPVSVLQHLTEGAAGRIAETPQRGEVFDRQVTAVVCDAGFAARAAVEAADALGHPARIVTTELEGEAREIARRVVRDTEDLAPGEMLVYAGETTVTVTGEGRGGRNQELALAASIELSGRDDVILLALGTDGIDGATDSAGAFGDGTAIERARRAGMDAHDHLLSNDSHTLLAAIGDTADCGPTGTNVGDLVLVAKAPL